MLDDVLKFLSIFGWFQHTENSYGFKQKHLQGWT